MSIHALASLTATYTDSEPDGEEEDNLLQDEKKSGSDEDAEADASTSTSININTNTSITNRSQLLNALAPTFSVQEAVNRSAKLVSYHDDTVLSDEADDLETAVQKVKSEVPQIKNSVDNIGEVELPAEPTGRCSPKLVEKVVNLNEKIQNGLDMNKEIQSRKEFRNPSIYEKLIQFCGLNELGTNYPVNIYDPTKWGKESHFEELAKVQKLEMDRREKEKKERTKVEFVSGTKKSNFPAVDDDMKKRKSKWDQVGAVATNASMPMGVIRPAGLLQPCLTTSVTGTKGTVISAFGSLPKKPRI